MRSCGPLFSPVGPPGQRKIGVLIGISDYLHGTDADTLISDLRGPAEDVDRMILALSGLGGMGYHRENICTLRDQAATAAGIEGVLSGLPAVLSPGDEVVVFYSGHGGSVPDLEHDEPDQTDETLLPYDVDPETLLPAVTDDRLREHLAAIHGALAPAGESAKLTLIVDACSSGSVARGAPTAEPLSAEADGSLPGLVVLAAARDNTEAIGYSDGGVFTTSLERAIRSRRPGQSWGQTALRAQELVYRQEQARGASYIQVPVFEGALSRPVTGEGGGLSADGHVESVSPLRLSVINPAGWGPGAVVEILPATTPAGQLSDPLRRRRLATIAQIEGFSATGALEAGDWEPLVSDKVFLVQPSAEAATLPVELDPSLAPEVRAAIEQIPGVSSGPGGFGVSAAPDGAAEIRDGSGRLRNRVPASDAAGWMRLHVRQQALLRAASASTQGGLRAEAVPVEPGPWWPVCEADQQQLLPACGLWQPQVLNVKAPSVDVTALLLTSDGCIEVVPSAGEAITLERGQQVRLKPDWAFQAEGAAAVPHTLLVVGVPSEQPSVPVWSDLETTCGPQSVSRGGAAPPAGAVWISALSLQVSANPSLTRTACQAPSVPASVDLTPYLPPAPHPLRALLQSIDAGTLSSLDGALSATEECAGRLQSGDLLQRGDGSTALVVDPARGLVWSSSGYALLGASGASGCARDPAVSRPLPEALCLCCGAP